VHVGWRAGIPCFCGDMLKAVAGVAQGALSATSSPMLLHGPTFACVHMPAPPQYTVFKPKKQREKWLLVKWKGYEVRPGSGLSSLSHNAVVRACCACAPACAHVLMCVCMCVCVCICMEIQKSQGGASCKTGA